MIIEIESLEVVFHTGAESIRVLDIPRWSVSEGERVAIFGPSGSGKSTLLHAVAGLLPVAKGSISVCGQLLEALSEAQRDLFRAGNIGYIYQNFNLLQGFTVLENVLLGMTFSPRKPDVEEAEHLLGEVGLSHRITYPPSRLSSGEQQRVAVARALANRPRILLADEPTASLHPSNKADVLTLLLDVCDTYGCTLVVVTHEREVLSMFGKTVTFLDLNRVHHRAKKG